MFQNVSGLTVEHFAYCIQRLESYTLHLAGLKVGKINVRHSDLLGQFIKRHLTVRHHSVQSYDNSHSPASLRDKIVVFLKFLAINKDLRDDSDINAHDRDDQINIVEFDLCGTVPYEINACGNSV